MVKHFNFSFIKLQDMSPNIKVFTTESNLTFHFAS